MQCNFCEMLENVQIKEVFDKYWSKSRIPIVGGFEISFKCNLFCVHCYAAAGRGYSDLSFNQIAKIIDEMADEGTLLLSLTGGEPLLREDFSDIYKYIKRKGILIELLTNATLVDDKIIDILGEYPPVKLDISMYGRTEQTYERVTRVKGSYNKFMTALEKLRANNIPFDLKTIVLSINKDEVFSMKAFAKDLGVGFRYSFNVSPMINGDTDIIQYRLSPDEAIKFDILDEGRREFWSSMKQKEYKPEDFTEGDNIRLYLCKAGKHVFHIDATGKLFLCSRERCHGYDLLYGSFSEGWHGHIASLRKRTASTSYPCIRCKYLRYCDQCPADFELENGDPEEPNSFRCEIAKMRAGIFD